MHNAMADDDLAAHETRVPAVMTLALSMNHAIAKIYHFEFYMFLRSLFAGDFVYADTPLFKSKC